MAKLEITIPTYNHPEMVAFLVENYDRMLVDYNDIIISFHDSSTSNESEEIIKKSYFYDNKIFYYKYGDIDVDTKTIKCFEKSKADYCYLVGDGWLVNIEAIIKSNVLNNNYDLIHIYDENVKKYNDFYDNNIKEPKIYKNREQYLYDNFWHLILYGSSIIHRNLFSKFDCSSMKKIFDVIGFIYPCTVAYYLSDNIYVCKMDNLIPNPSKKESMWVTNKTGIEIWCKNFYLDVNKLSDVYNETLIKTIIKINGNEERTAFLSFRGLFKFKMAGSFNFSIYRKYKYYINKTMSCSKIALFTILFTPRFILKLIFKTFRLIRRKS